MGASAKRTANAQDAIDRRLAAWAPELPDIDLEVEAIVERIGVLSKYLKRSLDETLSEYGLTSGEWHVLGALKRSGPPYQRTPGQLATWERLSSGAMTNRLDRLEEAGFIRRLPHPDDRRAVVVELTEAGHRIWVESVGAQAAKEALVASALGDRDKRQLNRLLRRLMLELERGGATGAD